MTLRNWCNGIGDLNPLYRDIGYGAASRYGTMLAHPMFPMAFGWLGRTRWGLPGVHGFYAGNDWELMRHVRPGDHLKQERSFAGYKITETAFAGPTMFANGDTVHRNQHGALVAKERATSIRYLIEEANKRGVYGKESRSPKLWTRAELDEIARLRLDWIRSNREGVSPRYGDVKVGDTLPRRPIGPHSWRCWGYSNASSRTTCLQATRAMLWARESC